MTIMQCTWSFLQLSSHEERVDKCFALFCDKSYMRPSVMHLALKKSCQGDIAEVINDYWG